MLIVRSTFSCASAEEGNQVREATRSREWRRGLVPSHSERASPNKVNPFRPRYAKISSASLPEMVKPVIHGEETSICNHEDDRGGWGERALKEQWHVPGDPLEQGSSCGFIKVIGGTSELRNLLETGESGICRLQMQTISDVHHQLWSQNGRYKTRMNPNCLRESITWGWLKRKSDRSIVAEKGGNASGAKGSSFSHVFNKIRRSA